MATATVYTVDEKTNLVIDQFDCDYNFAIGAYHGKRNHQGRYYIARKGVKIPYKIKSKILKSLHRSSQAQE